MTAQPTTENHDHWWVYAAPFDDLHALPRAVVNPDDTGAVEEFRNEGIPAVVACGATDTWWWPGIFSRVALSRCGDCCDQLSIPRGTGTPDNGR